MTPTRRQLEKEIADLAGETPGERPPELTAEEKAALDDVLSVDTDDMHGSRDAASDRAEFLAALEAEA